MGSKLVPPDFPCPRCGAKSGEPCVNYLGKRKAQCPERSPTFQGRKGRKRQSRVLRQLLLFGGYVEVVRGREGPEVKGAE